MESRIKFLIFIAFVSFVLTIFPALLVRAEDTPTNARAAVLYVAVHGDDHHGNGSWDRPYATLSHAAAQAKPGDTIYVRGGVYKAVQQTISAHGTVAAPITIQPQDGEQVILDGSGANIGAHDSIINIENASYVILAGFEVRNSSGRGISVRKSEHIVVRDNRVHDIDTRGIGGSGHNLLFEGNEVWHAALQNEGQRMDGGWAAAMSTWSQDDGSLSTNIIFRNNYVHDSWGEGIIALLADNVVIENNTIHDTFSVNLYVDNATNVLIQSNYLYATTHTYDRQSLGYPATGINLANEEYAVRNPVRDIVIANNLIVGTGRGLNFWHDTSNSDFENSYQDIHIVYNVIKDTFSYPIRFFEISSNHRQPNNVLLQNNIIFKGQDGQTIDVGNQNAWVILYNNWPDSNPTLARDASNFSADPLFVNPVIGGPREGFQLQPHSPNIGAGVAIPGVDYDYRGVLRSSIQTTIGFYEPQATGNNLIFLPAMSKGE